MSFQQPLLVSFEHHHKSYQGSLSSGFSNKRRPKVFLEDIDSQEFRSMGVFKWFLLTVLVAFVAAQSEVVDLDTSNFEKLTQAATGATTGDWLIKFYAPWCGHCKTLAPVFEEVAEQLKGTVNVARVDVMKSRELGTRFDIQGFPTIKLISKGNVYTFKGRRTVDEIAEFARGGFEMHEPEKVPGELGYFGEIVLVYKHAYKTAAKDLANGKYFSIDVFLVFMPFIFGFFLLLLVCMPAPKPPQPVSRRSPALSAQSGAGEDASSSVPKSVRARPPTSSEDTATKKDE